MNNIYLQTACAQILSDNDGFDSSQSFIRLVIDGGSQLTFVKECLSRDLNLPVVGTHKLAIMSFGNSQAVPARECKRVAFTLKGLHSNSEPIKITAIEVPEICFDSLIAPSETDPVIYDFGKCNDLADINTCNIDILPGISILIGADMYWKIVENEVKRLTDSLTAVSTKLGWTIHGESNDGKFSVNLVNSLHVQVEENCNNEIDVKKFWDLEAVGIMQPEKEQNLSTTKFVDEKITFENGRYTVSLPWIDDHCTLNSNFDNALWRAKSLTKKLIRNNKLTEYDHVVRDYLRNDCAELAPSTVTGKIVYFMPHRPVYREDKDTTKVRCVFDASSHMPGFPSLNDVLLPGENLVPLLLKVLINFRLGDIAIIADIEKAFLQIQIREKDHDSHRFLWYAQPITDVEKLPELVEFRMKRVTFGVTCSPFLLAATLKRHLLNQPNEFEYVSKCLLNAFYVDDLIIAVDDMGLAEQIFKQGLEILSNAGMNLRKWCTNVPKLMETMKNDTDSSSHVKKVLGLLWYPHTDELGIDVTSILKNLQYNGAITKRQVLQIVAKIYDPLGVLSPFVIRAKILIQEIWRINLDWDTILPNSLFNEFNKWIIELHELTNFVLPRSVLSCYKHYTELHIFADASPKAYGAVAYLKSVTENQAITCNILMAKNRVAPINESGDKSLTLPRLELTGALCAARLQHFILSNLKIEINCCFLWTDSKIALHWIQGKPTKWKTYICHRVAEIQKLSEGEWRHCPGEQNPADYLTRGIKATTLLKSSIWRHGPLWLLENSNEWPQNDVEIDPETVAVYAVGVAIEMVFQPIFPLENHSGLEKALRISSYVLKFLKLCQKKNQTNGSGKHVTAAELTESERYWIKVTQQQYFGSDLCCLKASGKVDSDSRILTLTPFIGDFGILRLGGRLQESLLNYETKHPIILPNSSTLTDLLIWQHHIHTKHGGVNATLTSLRKKYWILRARQRIKTILYRCMKCKKLRVKPGNQHFAPLPRSRLFSASPFQTTGVDFAGPLYITSQGEKLKVYIMLLTCAVVRAIHLELVPNLSAESCIRALRRFISRRGVPEVIYSDNAKTFKRTSLELNELAKILTQDEVQTVASKKRIEWRFIVERASWWGGFWERLVRSIKDALKLTLGKRLVDYDELQSTLAEIEATINGRPLTYIHNDQDDLLILTPAHFLLGPDNYSGFSIDLKNKDIKRSEILSEWKQRNELIQKFWKRWSTDYLQQLRSAVHTNIGVKSTIFNLDDIVLVHDQNLPRLCWKMARVTQLFPGRDGKIRACEVKLSNGTFLRRPIQLLYPLEITAARKDVENDHVMNAPPGDLFTMPMSENPEPDIFFTSTRSEKRKMSLMSVP